VRRNLVEDVRYLEGERALAAEVAGRSIRHRRDASSCHRRGRSRLARAIPKSALERLAARKMSVERRAPESRCRGDLDHADSPVAAGKRARRLEDPFAASNGVGARERELAVTRGRFALC
jgi:hypothetical protein